MQSGDQDSTASAPFIAIANRDAYATVRGFIFQVQRTVLAWIELGENTALYCESGEDIDFVQALAEPGDGERLLEQVKQREQPLSLRSPAVLEAIGNYLTHRKNNPHLHVRFRFFTNAVGVRTFPRVRLVSQHGML